jgi:hypothetical protein
MTTKGDNQMTDFQPMDIAPRDGTDVILKIATSLPAITHSHDPTPSDEIPAYYCDCYNAWLSNGHWTDRETEFGDDTPTYVASPVGWKLDTK